MAETSYYGIIPARYASSRFPAKPLANIAGRPMFWHVWHRASQCPALKKVVLATDSPLIADAAKALDVPYVMTRDDHQSGTDRVFEAATLLGVEENAVVVNIQGDEPALNPAMLSELVAPFADDDTLQASTLARIIAADEVAAVLANPNVVKVVCNALGNALYFSRAAIPFAREAGANACPAPCMSHVGLYAFRYATLRAFTQFAQTPLEKTEKLEQLRLLENGINMRVVPTKFVSHGVDTPEDIAQILPLL